MAFDVDKFIEKGRANQPTSNNFDVEDFIGDKKESKSISVEDPNLINQGLSWQDVLQQAQANLGSSATQAGKDLITPFVEPVQTAKSLGNLALGAVQKVIPGEQSSEKYADAVGKFFADRYGGMENFKKTVAKDPAGVLLDLTTILSGGGSAVARAPGLLGKASKASKVGKAVETTGKTIRNIGNFADPINLLSKGIGKTLTGVVNPSVSRLMKQGVTPTMGQILQGSVKATEDALTGIPVLGTTIVSARQRANTQLNKATMDRVLKPIGESAKDVAVGSDGLAYVSDKLSDAYNKVLSKISLKADDALIDGIADAIASRKAEFEPAKLRVIENLIDEKILSKLDSDKPISGKQLQSIQSDLKKLSAKYDNSAMASERTIGEAIEVIEGAFRDALIRANPKYASELSNINKGYANYTRLRKAVLGPGENRKGADVGPFTPAGLRQAVKAEDKSLAKGDFARGRALMQDLSQDAQRVMGGNLPTSGTGERTLLAAILAGGAYIDPGTLALIAGAGLPYLPGTQRLTSHALASRPKSARALGQALQNYGPRIGRSAFQMGRINREME
tara:strand:- start:448 stop:2142 length:1695 start_codon:yes stop_codon:yes gene_type:complete